ncbi:stress response protein SCP2 [Streptomyces sp. SAI-135]|uniref:TerD family protein n=1 Tax=unclassified Streptomyces TaxID=2593676 RepID=UPI0024739983|nr:MULTISPECIES: TerD family protein [unclassified Streptomyces]MDH6520840.1 stress response protein SCP2 [Streptomyces sp. SAI-090]MDH6553060.1 stress response protein SCP2 [Streptomyces sp. SAI-041]MDH6572142.1 stress response protein SCP2 [Streptomyces sp. SAI-117]MDH6615068.1 stress response protein SCP2 [Streptomyces sp. SAI-135]
MVHRLESLVIRHALRLPAPAGPAGEGDVAARRFDAALMSAGFKLSADALRVLSGLSESTVVDTAVRTLATVREMTGDHVRHNVYFKDFPANVPDTFEFWMRCVREALEDGKARSGVLAQLRNGVVNLLTLPSYGTYRHTYEEMLAAHDELTAAVGDRLTVLHLGGALEDELTALYLALAGSTTPLGDEHLADLRVLAGHCADGPQPETIPVRENRAVVNEARLKAGSGLLLDTVTDVLRLACALSGGDVSLQEPTRLSKLSRPVRRALLAGLDEVVAGTPAKLADVLAHREAFKRLGERLHPHEYPRWPHAAEVFAVARGEKKAYTFEARVEALLGADDVLGATELLRSAPGRLLRALDRLLRTARTQAERDAVVAAVEEVAPQVSGRVVLSVREYLHNRAEEAGRKRVFINRAGRAHVTDDARRTVPEEDRKRLIAVLDAETARRLPSPERLLVDPDVLGVALPLSGRAASAGLGVLPRGSVSPVDGELLRFFVYWKQTRQVTDYDLSALLLDADYETVSWLSYTNLREVEGEHSGDITDAPDGASEFINLRLGAVRGTYIVPQVNIYSGEKFEDAEESFFGFMLREGEQKGQPFEARTVRMKSELRGPGRVALPLAFRRAQDGSWHAKWLHLYLKGHPAYNRVEGNQVSVATLLRAVVEREQLTVGYLADLMANDGTQVATWDPESVPDVPVTYIGLERPEGLHPESVVITPENLRDLIPE